MLKSESLEPLIGFLAFQVEKLWPKKINFEQKLPQTIFYPTLGKYLKNIVST